MAWLSCCACCNLIETFSIIFNGFLVVVAVVVVGHSTFPPTVDEQDLFLVGEDLGQPVVLWMVFCF